MSPTLTSQPRLMNVDGLSWPSRSVRFLPDETGDSAHWKHFWWFYFGSPLVHVGLFWFTLQLLDFEARSAEQVPLLLKMKRSQLALSKAVESGDTDLGE